MSEIDEKYLVKIPIVNYTVEHRYLAVLENYCTKPLGYTVQCFSIPLRSCLEMFSDFLCYIISRSFMVQPIFFPEFRCKTLLSFQPLFVVPPESLVSSLLAECDVAILSYMFRAPLLEFCNPRKALLIRLCKCFSFLHRASHRVLYSLCRTSKLLLRCL